MAVKTSDVVVRLSDFTINGIAVDANKKTAIRIDELQTSDVKKLSFK